MWSLHATIYTVLRLILFNQVTFLEIIQVTPSNTLSPNRSLFSTAACGFYQTRCPSCHTTNSVTALNNEHQVNFSELLEQIFEHGCRFISAN